MAKKIQLKPQHGRIAHPRFGDINNSNITEEIYNALVAEAEGHKDLFNVTDESEEKSESKTKKLNQKNDGTAESKA